MRFQVLLSILVLIIVANSCTKDKMEYDPNEVAVTINAGNLNESYRAYILIENKKSSTLFIELAEGENFIPRGEEIVGDLINLHFVYVSNLWDDDWAMTSYYDISIGKEIDLPDRNASSTSEMISFQQANISFSDVPDFDVVTRSANYPEHCHTWGSLDVPCAYIGYDTYFVGENFYVCMQKDESAGYKLVSIPEVDDYVISLSELNKDMTKYSFLKNANFQQSISVHAYGNSGAIRIFYMRPPEESLFSGDSIDVFVPNGLPQMETFSTSVYKSSNNAISRNQHSYYLGNQVVTSLSFLDVGLNISHTSGEFPVVSTTSDNYDVIKLSVRLNSNGNYWTIYAPDGQSFYTPEFPDEVHLAISDDFQISQFLSATTYISVSAIKDSRYKDYNDAVDDYLNIREFTEESYSTLIEDTWLQDL